MKKLIGTFLLLLAAGVLAQSVQTSGAEAEAQPTAQTQLDQYRAASREEATAKLKRSAAGAVTYADFVVREINVVNKWLELKGKDSPDTLNSMRLLHRFYGTFGERFVEMDNIFKANKDLFAGEDAKSFEALTEEAWAVEDKISDGLAALRKQGLDVNDTTAQTPDPPTPAHQPVPPAATRETAAAASRTCPIAWDGINPHTRSSSFKTIFVDALSLRYKNTTDQQITGIKFRVVFTDATGDAHEWSQNLIDTHGARPGKVETREWDTIGAEAMDAKAQVWPIKVMFKDGTTWEDDGSKQCAGDSVTYTNKGSWWTR